MDFFKIQQDKKNIQEYCNERNLELRTDIDYTKLILLKYNRDVSDLTDSLTQKCRGLILDKDSLLPVFYGLNSRIEYRDFKEKTDFQDITITKLVDGTMINLFYHNGYWTISTKSKIDASKSFWNNTKSFYQLFNETTTLNISSLDIKICYSFVMVHTSNRIVKKYDDNSIHLVFARNLETGLDVTSDINTLVQNGDLGNNIFPLEVIDGIKGYDDLEDRINNSDLDKVGFMLWDKNGDRAKIYTPEFQKVKDFNGNHYNYIYRMLKLKQTGELNDFLKYYPEQIIFKKEMESRVINISRYILKLYHDTRKNYIEYPSYLAKHMYNLHQIYLKDKNDDSVVNSSINLKKVLEYFWTLHFRQQYFILKNYGIN